MRKDMSKIVGKPKESVRYVRRPGRLLRADAVLSMDDDGQVVADDLELLPTRERMVSYRSRYLHVKNGAPLLRWLRSQVGRRWSTVYAELASRFDARTPAGYSMREFLDNNVYHNVFEEDGVLMAIPRDWGGSIEVARKLYVDPKTGLLMRGQSDPVSRTKSRLEREARAAERDASRVIVSKSRQLHRLDGVWYWVDLAPITPAKRYTPKAIKMSDGSVYQPRDEAVYETVCRDILSDHSFEDVPTQYTYGASRLREQYGTIAMYGVRKHQASQADIRRHVR
jgi:hypothetical protein